MTIVEIPSAMVQDNPFLRPFSSSEFQNKMHLARCTLIVCNFNRNQPYVLVLGKLRNCVDHAAFQTKDAMDRLCMDRFMQKSANKSFASNAKLPPKTSPPKSKLDHPRKLMIPGWLLSDDFFLQQTKGGLFGSEWCKQANFQEKTGCDLVFRSQYYLLIKPSPNSECLPKLNIATTMIENALLKVLGVDESRCKLLYDLTLSYTQHPVDGIIHMRNPLSSAERVWANIIDLSPYSKLCHTSLVKKEVNEEMHKLWCTLKICRENFGVKLFRCRPYVMIMGRHKASTGAAIDFVKRVLKKHTRDTEINDFEP